MPQIALLLITLSVCSSVASAAEPVGRWIEGAAVAVDIPNPPAIVHAKKLRAIVDRIYETRIAEAAWQGTQGQELQELWGLVSQRFGWKDPTEMVALFDQGLTLEIGAVPPRAVIVARSSSPKLLGEAVGFLVEILRAGAPQTKIESGDHAGFSGYRIGNSYWGTKAGWLVIASDSANLAATIDRVNQVDEPQSGQPANPRAPAAAGAANSLLSVRLDLAQARLAPDLAKALQVPAADPNIIVFLGGWFDLLNRFDRFEGQASEHNGGLELELRVAAPSGDLTQPGPLAGFWASSDEPATVPLLNVPNMIYSNGWRRNYGAMWAARKELVTEAKVAEMEQGDTDAAKQIEVFGISLRPSEFLSGLGPNFRVVAAAQAAAPYDIKVRDVLPAFAAAIELRDPQHMEATISPAIRIFNLILGGEQRVRTEATQHLGHDLTTLSFLETEEELRRRPRGHYNFRTTYSFASGHFVIGTSPLIVRQIIDQLENEQGQADAGAAQPANRTAAGLPVTTERLSLDMAHVASALGTLQESLVRDAALKRGDSPADAEHDLNILREVLTDLGSLTAEMGWQENGFQIQAEMHSAR